MKRALAFVLVSMITTAAHGEEARPGRTLVLELGIDPAAPSPMPSGPHHDARLVYPLPTTAPTVRQIVALPGTRMRGPTIDAEGRIYVATSEGVRILAPDGSTNALVLDDALDATPVLLPGGDGVALTRDGSLTRFAPDGTVRRRAQLGLSMHFAPLVEDDGRMVLVGASRMLALLGPDLEVQARRELPDGLALAPTRTTRGHWAIAAGTDLVLVDPSTVEILRVIALPGRAVTPAVASADGALWIATVEGELVSVRGELRIGVTISLGSRLTETTSDRAMIGLAPNGDVLAVVPARGLVRIASDGHERWVWESETPLAIALSIDAEGRAAVIDRLGHFSVIDAEGSALWTIALESLPLGPAIVTAQGRIVVVTERGVVLLGP